MTIYIKCYICWSQLGIYHRGDPSGRSCLGSSCLCQTPGHRIIGCWFMTSDSPHWREARAPQLRLGSGSLFPVQCHGGGWGLHQTRRTLSLSQPRSSLSPTFPNRRRRLRGGSRSSWCSGSEECIPLVLLPEQWCLRYNNVNMFCFLTKWRTQACTRFP